MVGFICLFSCSLLPQGAAIPQFRVIGFLTRILLYVIQGQGPIPQCDTDAAGLSEDHTQTSPEGMEEPQNAVNCRPDFSLRPRRHNQSSHRASRTVNTPLSPTLSDQSPLSRSKS